MYGEGGGCATTERLAFGFAHGDPYGVEDTLVEVEVAVVIVPAHKAAVALGCTAKHPAEEGAAGEGEFAVVYAHEAAVGTVARDAAGDVDVAVAVGDVGDYVIITASHIINGNTGAKLRRGGGIAGNSQVLDGGTFEVAEGRATILTIGLDSNVECAAVAVERAAEGLARIRGNHLGDGFVAVVERVGELVTLGIHMFPVYNFLDVVAEDVPVVGVGNDVGITRSAGAREGLNNLKAGGLLAGVRTITRDGQRVCAGGVGRAG